MTREDFTTRWRSRRDELARLGATVDGVKFCDEVLADFEAVVTFEDEALLSLEDAAARWLNGDSQYRNAPGIAARAAAGPSPWVSGVSRFGSSSGSGVARFNAYIGPLAGG